MESSLVINGELIEQALVSTVGSRVELLRQASEHIIRAGGKRIRPRVVLLAYQAAGGQDPSQTIPVAAAVELLHTASLVHDDINDRSDLRRGRETVNARWGTVTALLTGDFLFSQVIRLVATLDARIIQVLADACVSVVEGETRQMLTLGDLEMSEETYLEIVSQKTAALFAGCAQSGGILAGATDQQASALGAYGLNLGIVFQIRDDMLDCMGKEGELGKPVAADLRQRKMNLALIAALRESKQVKEALRAGDSQRVLRLLRETNGLEYAMDRAREYAQRAQDALTILPGSEARTELRGLVEFAIARHA